MSAPTFADQEHFSDPATGSVGDCWRACLASVLSCPIADVPHFVRDYPDGESLQWFYQTCRWLTENHSVTIRYYEGTDAVRAEGRAEIGSYRHILIDGYSPRGDWMHVVVGDAITGAIVHDPHPDRTGLRGVVGAFVLVAA